MLRPLIDRYIGLLACTPYKALHEYRYKDLHTGPLLAEPPRCLRPSVASCPVARCCAAPSARGDSPREPHNSVLADHRLRQRRG